MPSWREVNARSARDGVQENCVFRRGRCRLIGEYGGAGNDFIYTDDLITPSQDFVYVSGLSGFGTGIDTVADFTPGPGGDVAVIVGTPGLTSFAQVQAKMTDIGVYTVINLSATDQLYLYNVDPDQLTADNFLFL